MAQIEEILKLNGYTDIRTTPHGIVGLLPFIFTHAIVVGLDRIGYRCRYCYDNLLEARGALKDWQENNYLEEPEGWIVKK